VAAPAQLRIGVSIDGAGRHPAAWSTDPTPEPFGRARLVDAALRADESGLDLVVVEDAFGLQGGGPPAWRGRLDAVLALAAVAPLTSSVGLVATTDVTHTEPFHLSKNLATLDLVSGGRAAWWPRVSPTSEVAALFGRRPAAPPAELWAEAGEAIDVVRRLWDSWEDDAVIRDVPSGRYLDVDKVHYIDFVGRFFSVRGPSITPRSPQGQPPVVLAIDDAPALALAAREADIVVVDAASPEDAGRTVAELRAAASTHGRDAGAITALAAVDVLLDRTAAEARARQTALDAVARPAPGGGASYVGDPAGFAELVQSWTAGAIDGVLVRPVALSPTLDLLCDEVLPRLGRPPRPAARSFRERLGLARPANRYARAGDRR
jgi:alkanesulfonate monooxygenase SsuD/methylene tetrahydromethanopterin reductase-like flavin-dependent oxidoreductase (luciferase family)